MQVLYAVFHYFALSASPLALQQECYSSDPQSDTQKSCPSRCSRQGPNHVDEVHVSDVVRRKVEQACVGPLPGL
jgi:hypothetical protein